MKTAKWYMEAIGMVCAHCNQTLEDQRGTTYFFDFEYHELPETLKCRHCGRKNKVPLTAIDKAMKRQGFKGIVGEM